ncbi:hypothetical protein N7495_003074 [Penicillium taxi]|uniref:uncharacterized protein n=1 Tax=Penicillium taxi TaxID=168475 RepID=UPI0025452E06|nr:uncharacterized protein N7495_003074 [Penicillium taxi]KAJ5902546.1 hypothetical protein N7495_003074 [Penicillium taxi]
MSNHSPTRSFHFPRTRGQRLLFTSARQILLKSYSNLSFPLEVNSFRSRLLAPDSRFPTPDSKPEYQVPIDTKWATIKVADLIFASWSISLDRAKNGNTIYPVQLMGYIVSVLVGSP